MPLTEIQQYIYDLPVSRLPARVREYIKRLETQADPNNTELRLARQRLTHMDGQLKRMQTKVDAMTEIMTCAARGGHETCQAYVDRIIAEYAPDAPADHSSDDIDHSEVEELQQQREEQASSTTDRLIEKDGQNFLNSL